MAPGKKKEQKMSLGSFLQDESLGSWADEMEDMPTVPSSGTTGYSRSSGYDNDRFSGGFNRDRGGGEREDRFGPRPNLPLPDKPPFTAHVGNLSFDVTEGEIQDFFNACNVTNVRLVKDRMEDRPKGFGYVEFGDLPGLMKAIDLSGSSLAGRNVRVSVAEPPKDRQDDRSAGEWRRTGPLPPLDDGTGSRRPSASREFTGGHGMERRGSRFGDDGQEGDGKQRDFDNWSRKGPLAPLAPAPSDQRPRSRGDQRSFSGEGGIRRQRSPGVDRFAGGDPRGQKFVPSEAGESPEFPEGGRGSIGRRGGRGPGGPGRDFGPPAMERQMSASDRDNEWRRRPDPPSRSETMNSTPPSPVVPNVRPKLELKKRSEHIPETVVTPSSDSKASPFGAARPIDTDAKLKEIEEKQAKLNAERKIREDKAREEKKASREAREMKRGGSGSGDRTEKGKGDGEHPQPRRGFTMLRSESKDTVDTAAAEETQAEIATKTENPKEIAAEEKAPVEAPAVEEDGWSTVPVKGRGRATNGGKAVAT